MKEREADIQGERVSSQDQRGEAAVIWVILFRNENCSLSPMALHIGEDKKWGIQIELKLCGS